MTDLRNQREVFTWKTQLLACSILLFLFVHIHESRCESSHRGHAQENPTITPIVLRGIVNQSYIKSINSSVQYIYQYSFNSSLLRAGIHKNGDIRVHAHCDEDQDPDWPIMFVVRQQRTVLSWQLPQQSKTSSKKVYYKASRTLCSEIEGADGQNDIEPSIIVTVSTASPKNPKFTLRVSIEDSFIMHLDDRYNATVSPPSPRFYRFLFPHEVSSKYVLLEVQSQDTICMTVSVQNSTCPVFDEESNVQFEGYWQTMSTKAGMTLRRDRFPLGFYIVFVVHSDDSRCLHHDSWKNLTYSTNFISTRRKEISFSINEKITYTEYLVAIFGLIGIFLLFYVFSIVISCVYSCKNIPGLLLPIEDASAEPDANPGAISVAGAAVNADAEVAVVPELEIDPVTAGPMRQPLPVYRVPERSVTRNRDIDDSMAPHWLLDSDSSVDETEVDMLHDARRYKDIFRTTKNLFVAELAKKNPRVLAKKSQLYLWTLITVAIFYALPVVQLVFTYQNVLHTTGNEDLCYYNYLCSHPLWILSDFNHVYSNIGYIMLGFLFLVLVYRRDRMHQRLAIQDPRFESHYGIPRHFGLFYAMGLALIMEGFLSACYHVCPNESNFQFDTCFMYVIALMCILKIYQTRHPDVNASAYMSFSGLAFVVLIGVLGVMAGNIYFWTFFTIAHILLCLFLSLQIYYIGRWSLDCGLFRRVYTVWRNDCLAAPLTCLCPLYPDRMVLLLLANAANWTIAGFGAYRQSVDFASHLLLIFMANLFIYTCFYIVMKLTHREKILFQPLSYIILTIIFWSLGMYDFLQKSTSWQMTPAESRTFNRECLILRFYDTHDIWHAISAIGLFVWYMVLLTLDDDLICTPRDKIPVF